MIQQIVEQNQLEGARRNSTNLRRHAPDPVTNVVRDEKRLGGSVGVTGHPAGLRYGAASRVRSTSVCHWADRYADRASTWIGPPPPIRCNKGHLGHRCKIALPVLMPVNFSLL
jgi:hypothetical protein